MADVSVPRTASALPLGELAALQSDLRDCVRRADALGLSIVAIYLQRACDELGDIAA